MVSHHLILCHSLLRLSSIFFTSGSFPVTQLFTSGGQSTGASASASVHLVNIQGWFPLGFTDFYLIVVQGTLKSLLQYCSSKASILPSSVFFIVQLSHPYTTTGKTIALTRRTFVGEKVGRGILWGQPWAGLGTGKGVNCSFLWNLLFHTSEVEFLGFCATKSCFSLTPKFWASHPRC